VIDLVKSKLNDIWIVSYKEMKRYKDIIKGLRQQSKETERKIKEIIKNINGRKRYYEKAKIAHKKDKDISGIYFCVGLLSQCDRDLEILKERFPEYFKGE
jgi:hypothetical protein